MGKAAQDFHVIQKATGEGFYLHCFPLNASELPHTKSRRLISCYRRFAFCKPQMAGRNTCNKAQNV